MPSFGGDEFKVIAEPLEPVGEVCYAGIKEVPFADHDPIELRAVGCE